MAEAETFAFSADINQLLSLIINTVSPFSQSDFLARDSKTRARGRVAPFLDPYPRGF